MKIWKTKEGKEILIKDLEDSHLDNILKLMERKAKSKINKLVNFYAGVAPPSGEMASYAFEQEMDQAFEGHWEDHVSEGYWDLYNEKLNREKIENGVRG